MSKTCLGFPVMMVLILLMTGCGACNRSQWPQSPSLGHMDVSQKLAYMGNVKQNLTVFRTTLADIENHAPKLPPEERNACDDEQFSCEVYKYIEVYAKPIITDDSALTDLQTRLEVARINLLSALALYEIRQYSEARDLVRFFEKQYGEDPSVLNATIESREKFSTFGEGLRSLKRNLAIG